jgi:hypothetical protein
MGLGRWEPKRMKPLSADKSAIPEELRDHPEVLALEAEVLSQFADPEARKRTCVHEAAHEHYFRKVGIRTMRRGPFAFCDENTGGCRFANAGVYPANYDEFPDTVDIEELAKAYAAGCVAARELTALGAIKATEEAQNMGFGSDFDNFARVCKLMFNGATDRQIKKTFELAKTAVELELQAPELRTEIQRLANEFGEEIFGERVFT